MTWVCKQYEVKIKMIQEQRPQLTTKYLLGYNMKIVVWFGEINLWWRSLLMGEFFQGRSE